MKQSFRIVIYDSKCSFCVNTINMIHRHLNDKEQFLSADLRAQSSRATLRDYGIRFVALNTIYFITEGKIHNKSRAILELLKLTKLKWLSHMLLKLPQQKSDKLYEFVAKHRYGISSLSVSRLKCLWSGRKAKNSP